MGNGIPGNRRKSKTSTESSVEVVKPSQELEYNWDGFEFAGKCRPGKQTPRRGVPTSIMLPDYAKDSIPKGKGPRLPWQVDVKTEEDIEGMRVAGRIAREVLDAAGRLVKPGISTDDVDKLAHDFTVSKGAYPSPLNYHGFPKSVCTSVNEVICHGIPDTTSLLEEGDMVNIDVTIYFNGYHGDCSEMFTVGEVDQAGKELLQVTYDSWVKAMDFCEPGRPYKDIGGIIEDYVSQFGFSTTRQFCGHGIGSIFHTTPNILHYRNKEPNGVMQPGHTFTIEPMINEGTDKVLFWPDKWTATTADGGRSAQFEHTLLMTEDGVVPLTAKVEGSSMEQFWEKSTTGFYAGRPK